MTCKDCGAPIHWAGKGTEDGGAWYHDQLIDSWNCPVDWSAPIEPAEPTQPFPCCSHCIHGLDYVHIGPCLMPQDHRERTEV